MCLLARAAIQRLCPARRFATPLRILGTTPLCRWIVSTGATRCRPMPCGWIRSSPAPIQPAELQSRVPDQPLQYPAGVGRQPEHFAELHSRCLTGGTWAGSNEYVTQVTFLFGRVPGGFRQVETPYIYCDVLSSLPHEYPLFQQVRCGRYVAEPVDSGDRPVGDHHLPRRPVPDLPGQAT